MGYLFSNLRQLKEDIVDKINVILGGGELIPELTAEQLFDKFFEPIINEYGRYEILTQKIIEDKFNTLASGIEAVQVGTDLIIANGATEALQTSMKTVLDNIKAKTDNLDESISSLKTQVDLVTTEVGKIDAKTGTSVVASENLKLSDDPMVSVSDTGVWTKKKEITIKLPGTYTVKFDLRKDAGLAPGEGRVYLNGAGHGTAQSENSTTFATYSEDLIFDTDDLCQLYIKMVNGGSNAEAENFRLYCDLALIVGVVETV